MVAYCLEMVGLSGRGAPCAVDSVLLAVEGEWPGAESGQAGPDKMGAGAESAEAHYLYWMIVKSP